MENIGNTKKINELNENDGITTKNTIAVGDDNGDLEQTTVGGLQGKIYAVVAPDDLEV